VRSQLLLVAAVIAATFAVAQGRADEEKTVTLPELVVTPLRLELAPAEVPYASFVIDRDGLDRTSPRTTPDALSGLPSVMIQKTAYGQGSPYLRGFTGFRTLLMVDGVRLNNSVFRDGPNQYWNTVDPWSVNRYEVVLGPASVLYGSDAIGGAVNALTLAPPEWEEEAEWEEKLIYRGATADESHQGRVHVLGRPSRQLGIAAGVSYKDFDDLEGGEDVGDQPHTGYDEYDYDLKLDFDPVEDSRITLGHQHVNQDDAWRTHRTIYGIDDWEGLVTGDDKVHTFDQERTLTYLRLEWTDLGGFVDDYRVTLSRHAQAEDQERVRSDDRRDLQGFDVVTWGADLQLESDSAAGRWVYGVDYYADVVDSYRRDYTAAGDLKSVAIQGPVADDANYDLLGVFVQDTLPLAGGALELTPGVRYTRAEADADSVQDPESGDKISIDGDWDAVVGSLRLLAPIGDQRRHAIYTGVSQGFRAPNLSDLTRLDTARSNEIETPVEDLDPERYVTGEVGGRYGGEVVQVGAAYYYTDIRDMIVRTPTGRVIDDLIEVTKENASSGYVQGAELTVGWNFARDWSARATASWMDGEVEDFPTSGPIESTEYISRLMPLTGQLALRFAPPASRYWAEAVVDAADGADKLSSADKRDTQRIPPGGTPGYVVFTVRGGASVTRNLDLTLELENLADEDYRIHGSGVNEPGRNLIVTASLTF